MGGITQNLTYPTQAFKIDLSISWNASNPVIQRLPDGPSCAFSPSTLSSDGQSWFVVSNDTAYTYSIESATWNQTLSFNSTDDFTGSSAVTDPGTGLVFITVPDGSAMWMVDFQSSSFDNIAIDMGIPAVSSAIWSTSQQEMLAFDGSPSASILEYSPARNWSSSNMTGDIPAFRSEACFVPAANGSKAVYFGGIDQGQQVLGDIYVLDVVTMDWKRGPDVIMANRRAGAACAVSNNYFIAWGGSIKNSTGDTVILYDLKSGVWTSNFDAASAQNSTQHPSVTATTTATMASPLSTLPTESPSGVAPDSSSPSPSSASTSEILTALFKVTVVLLSISGTIFYRTRVKKAKDAKESKESPEQP
ncbi:hypothetical protein EDD21DRAFT_349483 [Dissophora ornata]|nr:hypothetical protein BGZ58_009489 [Dissophora ornata]KAI8606013.1 hypothetical protein EDD21DRAFT_349483 [Dissophora ornata]